MNRKVMAVALRGTKRKGGKVKTPGICALLGPAAIHAARSAPNGGDAGGRSRL
jgi:hypothetical protein